MLSLRKQSSFNTFHQPFKLIINNIDTLVGISATGSGRAEGRGVSHMYENLIKAMKTLSRGGESKLCPPLILVQADIEFLIHGPSWRLFIHPQ